MSRVSSTTRRSSKVTEPTIAAAPYAFVGPKCSSRNAKSGTENACLKEIVYLPYDYDITAWTVHVLVTLYAIATFVHIVQAILSKRWFLLGTFALCGLCETLGWGGRWWSDSTSVWQPNKGGYWSSELNAYLLQAITLCVGPCFLAIGWYILLGRFIEYLGPQYCRFTPKLASFALTGATVVAMAVQGAGGGITVFAKELSVAQLGSTVMLAGLAFQLFITILYIWLFIELVWRYSRNKDATSMRIRRTQPDVYLPKGSLSDYDVGKVKILMIATSVSVGFLFIRTCYRIVALVGGPSGPLAGKEMLFSAFDGGLILLALTIFNFIHPLWFLPPPPTSPETKAINEVQDDESFFDKTPVGHRRQDSQDSPKTVANWGFPKPKYMNQNEARYEESEYAEDSENLEWVPTNQRNTQMRPLYEGSVHHGRNDSR